VSARYRWASGVVLALLGLTFAASHYGWGLRRDPRLEAQRSLRTGSVHGRHYYGGGPGYGK
jgi:hypothetical protein